MSAPFLSPAAHHLEGRYRDGVVVITGNTAGFVPTSDWRSVLGEVALGLVTTRVELFKRELAIPMSDRELEALVANRGGVMIGSEWTWTRLDVLHKSFVLFNRGSESVRIAAPEDRSLLASWQRLAPASAGTKRKAILYVGGAAFLCAIAGIAGWQLADNADYLIAGLSFAGMLALALGLALHSLKRAEQTDSAA